MNYPNLPDKMKVPIYTGKEMQQYAEDAVNMYKNSVVNASALLADIKVKDSTIRTLQVELLKYRNMDAPVDWNELQRLRLRVKELEKRVSDYGWITNPDRMGQ